MTAEERAEVEKWEAWKECEGLSRTDAKRRYITTLIRTMHMYASGTAEARALVEELEFVWEQVSGNYNGNGRTGSGSGSGSGNGGLRVLRPMSEEGGDGSFRDRERSIAEVLEKDSGGDVEEGERTPDRESNSSQWRRRMERALVQMTAEVAALKELVDATNSQRRLWARSGKKGWVIWACMALWKLIKRAFVDVVVIAAAILILRWRYKERVEEWWEWLGDFMGFVRKNVKHQIKKRDVAALLGRKETA